MKSRSAESVLARHCRKRPPVRLSDRLSGSSSASPYLPLHPAPPLDPPPHFPLPIPPPPPSLEEFLSGDSSGGSSLFVADLPPSPSAVLSSDSAPSPLCVHVPEPPQPDALAAPAPPLSSSTLVSIPTPFSHPIVATVPNASAFQFLSVLCRRLLGVTLVLDSRAAAFLPTINEVLAVRDLVGTPPESLSDQVLAELALDLAVVCTDRSAAHDLAPFSYLFPKGALRVQKLTKKRIASRLHIFRVDVPKWMGGDLLLYADLILGYIHAYTRIDITVPYSTPVSHTIRDFHEFGYF